MAAALPLSPKQKRPISPWILSILLLTIAYGLLGLTFTGTLSHTTVMQRCVLVDPKMARIWSVGNVEIGAAYFGVFVGMTIYFIQIFRHNRAHLTDLGIACIYISGSFLIDYLCVQHFSPFAALLVGDAIIMTFTVIVSRQLWFQRLLGVFVPIIFLSCAVGHFLEGLSYWQLTYPFNVPWTMVTADIGFAVLVNSARFPAFIRGQDIVEELQEVRARSEELDRQLAALTQAKEGQRASEALFRATFEQAAVGIAQVGLTGECLQVNDKLCSILGYAREELLTRSFPGITHPDDLEADSANTRRLLEGKIQTFTMEKRYIHKNTSLVWINLSVSLVRTATGEPQYFISIIEDITERKRLENQLLQAQKLESVGRLSGGIAHDFNNLLTVIMGSAELASEEVSQHHPCRIYLQNVLQASERAANLTQQLLAFARKQVIAPQVVNLNELILRSGKLLRRLITENIELVILPHEGLHSVRVDPGQFEQILINLVVNARDAMPEGGKLTIETDNVVFDAEYARRHDGVAAGEYIMLAVSDTGIGIDEAVRLHIFEPFFTTKEKGRGTGLGLATVYGIVKQSEGHIWLYTESGKGTTFKIYLPRTTAPAEKGAPPLPAALAAGGSETVLLVEDEPGVRALAREVLTAQGYTVLEATNGEEALRLVSGREPEIALLITDVIMPVMGGKELADRLHAVHPNLKVLYISGYTENTIVHNGVLYSGVAFLAKPFTSLMLGRKVREILEENGPDTRNG